MVDTEEKKASKRKKLRNFWFTIIIYGPRLRLVVSLRVIACICVYILVRASVCLFYFHFIGFFLPLLLLLCTTTIYAHISWNQFKRSEGIKSGRWPPADPFRFFFPPGTSTALFANSKPIIYKISSPKVCVCVKTMNVTCFLSTKNIIRRYSCQSRIDHQLQSIRHGVQTVKLCEIIQMIKFNLNQVNWPVCQF